MKNSYYKIGGIFFGLMLTAVSGNTKAQTRTISGTVTASGKPLSEVTISQEGNDQVTTTSENGTYTLQVSAENPILLFRHPEYAEERITATHQNVVNISLEHKVKGIEEVILNAGYYKVKEKERTGSIAKVSAKDIENQPITNILSAAQGRMAGVSIIQNSGVPGGGFDIQIRGKNSLRSAGNEPLYIVDGLPLGGRVNAQNSAGILPSSNINPLNGINPNDIESMEILKDADATAIYGTRGANGVILITTKKGTKGKTKLTLNTHYGLSKVASHFQMMNTQQYLEMRRQAFANAGISTYPTNAYDINGRWDQGRDTDWQKVLIGSWAGQQSTMLSVSAGGENSSFLISGGHTENTTVFPGDFRYKTSNLMSSYSYRSSDKKLSISSSNTFSTSSNNVINADLTSRSLFLSPNAPALYNADGSLNWQEGTFANPMAALEGTYTNTMTQFNQSLTMDYDVGLGFEIKLNGGLNYQDFEEFSIKPNTMFNPASASGSSSQYSTSSKGNNRIFSFIIEPQLGWSKKLGRHKLDVLIGTSYQQVRNRQSGVTGTGFASNALLYNIAAASTKTFRDEIDNDYRYGSVYGRVNYQWGGRYILNLTGRRDGSSRFGSSNRYANFGAVGAAWIFSEEKLLKESRWLSFGKLRGSYGVTGSDAIGDYQYLDTYTLSGSSYNNVVGFYPSRLYNPFFSWEKTRKLELALQLGFFKDAVSIQAAWYRNRSSSQLVGIPLPATTGFSSIQSNLDAVVQNKGWEFELSVKPFKNKNWNWSSSFNISIPQSKLLSFPGLEGSTYANTYVLGYPTSIVKLYQYEGINPATGLYRFTDFNNDGKISSPNDNQIIENLGTRFFGGWSNELRYRNMTLSFLFQFVKQVNYNYISTMPYPGNLNNQPAAFSNVWSSSNPSGTLMPYSTGSDAQINALNANYTASTAAVGDASFIRLKNVQLNYKINVQSPWIKEAVVYVQGQNLWTLTHYFGLDPEFTSTGFLPPLKTYSIGCQITF